MARDDRTAGQQGSSETSPEDASSGENSSGPPASNRHGVSRGGFQDLGRPRQGAPVDRRATSDAADANAPASSGPSATDDAGRASDHGGPPTGDANAAEPRELVSPPALPVDDGIQPADVTDAPRLSRENGRPGPPIGPIAILGAAGFVLLILLVIILIGQDSGTKKETAPPCLETDLPTALSDIADGKVSSIRASAATNDPDLFALAVEMDLANGGCLSLPQGPNTLDQRTAIVGAATIYNAQTEGRQIDIQIDKVKAPPTTTPKPTATSVPPTVPPTALPTGVPVVQPTTGATPAVPATPIMVSMS